MKKNLAMVVILTLMLQLVPSAVFLNAHAESVTEKDDFAGQLKYKSNNAGYREFSFNLFHKVALNGDENPLISPACAYFALAMDANGAKNETKKAFEDVLGMPAQNLNDTCRKLMEDLQKTKGNTTLNIANSMWMQNNIKIYESFIEILKKYYNAETFRVDFCTDAKDKINDWISTKTNGLIPTLQEAPLDGNTGLVLLNTIYLKAKWELGFDKRKTFNGEFVKEDGTKVTVPFLNSSFSFLRCFEDDDAEGIILPYNDNKLVFLAMRPRNGKKVNQFASELNSDAFHSYLKTNKQRHISLSMPKFSMDYKIILNDLLKNMGLSVAFDTDRGDFSNIGPDIYMSTVLQKIKMEVNEGGTEAAAVTLVEKEIESMPVEFNLNSPYVYAVVDKESELPLFMGIMNHPN